MPWVKPGTAFVVLGVKSIAMKTLLLIKEIYAEGFRNLGHILVKESLRIFTWFSFALFIIVLYAFLFRVFTGFAFD